MKLEEAVIVLNNLADKDLIELIKKYIDKKSLNSNDNNEKIENVFKHSLQKNNVSDKIFLKHIKDVIKAHCSHYYLKFPYLQINKIGQVDLLKYDIGEENKIHTDYIEQKKCSLFFILNLNENYEGGDFVFYNQNDMEIKRIKCKTTTCIMFPNNFLYPYKIEPITKGTRYSIIAWLI